MIVNHLPYLLSKHLVLASQSPRRLEILKLLGLPDCAVEPSRFDERTLRREKFDSARAYVLASASRKADEVCERVGGHDLLLAADTVVVVDGRILEKPSTEAEAIEFLRLLSGRSHEVLTAVALRTGPGGSAAFVESTDVRFARLDDEAIAAYVASGEPMDKAGGYGVQGMGGSFVTGINGCYFNVMGLPMHRVAAEISTLIEAGKL